MPADATTFYLAFTTVFGGLAAYLWWIDRRAARLEEQLRLLETARGKNEGPPGGAPCSDARGP